MNVIKLPLVTVVTVVLNDVENIENTIQSVVNQTYSNIEYIIIDGVSSDGTIEKILKYKSNISTFVSEPDKGLYDAMNKGTERARGEWIIYMNSGDRFYDSDVLSKVFIDNNNIVGKSVIYTDTIAENGGELTRIKTRNLKYIWMGPPSVHQSQFVLTSIAKSKLFNLKFKINADYDFCYYAFKINASFVYLPSLIISICKADEGISKSTNPSIILKENFLVSKQYSNTYQITKLFFINMLKYLYAVIRRTLIS